MYVETMRNIPRTFQDRYPPLKKQGRCKKCGKHFSGGRINTLYCSAKYRNKNIKWKQLSLKKKCIDCGKGITANTIRCRACGHREAGTKRVIKNAMS